MKWIIGFIMIALFSCQAPIRKIEMSKDKVTIKEDNKVIAALTTKWSEKYLTATAKAPIPPGYKDDSIGRSLARDAALVQCRTELYSQLGEIKLTETISVLNAVVNSHRTSEMQGTLRGAQLIDDRWDSENNNYIISLQLKQVNLVDYVKSWIDDGTVNPNQLDNALGRMRN